MAQSLNLLTTQRSPELAFDFISDFTHASLWDPRTQSVRKLSPGPIGLGTRFLLRARLLGPLGLDFPYEIVEYERPRVVTFAGKRPGFAYRERVSFTPLADGTRIEWAAHMELCSLLALGNPLLSLVYQRIGDDATSGIARALES
jgi:dehydrogenase/reductase SDR family protein 12